MNDSQIGLALRDTAEFISAQRLEYALIGGLAVAVRGEPRATLDIDAVLGCDIDRAIDLLENIGQSALKPYLDDVTEVVRTGLLLPLAA